MSTLTATPLYGYTAQGELAHMIHRLRKVTLCGRAADYVPEVQPVAPTVCRRCTILADTHEFATDDRTGIEAEGVCPGCGGTVVLNDLGMIQPHGEYRVGRDGTYWSKDPCTGAGQGPEVTP